MYKLYNKLFGWNYIAWKNSADQGVARVFVDGSGKICYFRYKNTKVIDEIYKPDQVIWLTCSPNKYFSNKHGNMCELETKELICKDIIR
jgi:hypothetical protein